MTSPDLPSPVHRYVSDFVAWQRRLSLLRAGGTALAAGVFILLVACLMDRVLRIPWPLRTALLAMDVGVVLLVLLPPLRRMIRRSVDWLAAAADIERSNPVFGQRLQTVVSQSMERSEYRGSRQMLEKVLEDVVAGIGPNRPVRHVRWRDVWRPWVAAGVLLLAVTVLLEFPSVGMPTLMRRFVVPFAAVPPVSTTQIWLGQPNQNLHRGQVLVIRARVERLTSPGVEIYTSLDRKSWSRILMQPVSDSEYTFTLPGMDRDLFYYVSAGDATTPVYRVKVLQPPAVAEYRARYQYPAYTRRGVVSSSIADGVIEAPAQTRVQLSVVATEPLASAVLSMGGSRIALSPGREPNVREAEFVVTRDQNASLEMISAGGLPGTVPGALTIRCRADRPPLARMLQPADDLRLGPREIVAIRYQALDDYGVESLALTAQVNAQPALTVPLSRQGDLRAQEGQFPLDLATLSLKIGDVVSISIAAADGAGHKASSEARRILISPRSIDINTHLRIAELRQAAQLAELLRQDLERAVQGLGSGGAGIASVNPDRAVAYLTVGRSLANGIETSLLLHQSLLRVAARSASEAQSRLIADCADRCRVLTWTAERLAAVQTGDAQSPMPGGLGPVSESVRKLAANLRALSEGEQASAIVADLGNVRMPPSTQPVDRATEDRRREALRRAQQDVEMALEELELKSNSADLQYQLNRRIEAAAQLTKAAKPLDFRQAAVDWSAAVKRGEAHRPPLVERLDSAAAVEAVGPKVDLVRARDLQLAARAAARIAEMSLSDAVAPAATRPAPGVEDYPKALAALQDAHDLPAVKPGEKQGGAADAVRRAAGAARRAMARWAQQDADELLAGNTARIADPEDIALQASAETAQRSYARAAALDQQLLQRVRGQLPEATASMEQVQRKMASVQAIDTASEQLQRVQKQTASAADPVDAPALARQQMQVVEKIDKLEEPGHSGADARRQATAALQQVQEQLAYMPQQVTEAVEAAAAYREAVARERQLRRDAESAPLEMQESVEAEVEQAQHEIRSAEDDLAVAAAGIGPEMVQGMESTISPFEPEANDAVAALGQRLTPALRSMQQVVRSGDRGQVERAAGQVRAAIEQVQWLLREGQFRITERDPLFAAKWYAEAASEALAAKPPDLRRAHTNQENANLALGYAWQSGVREAAARRLAVTPSFRPVVEPDPGDVVAGRSLRSLGQVLPGLRQWGFLRPRKPDSQLTPLRESEPSGYQEPLKLYFETLSKVQEEGGRK